MKGYANVLNVLVRICFWLVVIGIAVLGLGTALLLISPGLLPVDLATVPGLTVGGNPVNMELFSSFRTPMMILMGAVVVQLVLLLVMLSKISAALQEVIAETPFSEKCGKSLNTAATLTLISGILSIVMNFYAVFALSDLSNGNVSVQVRTSLSFIIAFVFLKMLAGIAAFGRGEQ